MKITFIGNCQTVSLCYYFQKLLNDDENVCWVLYGEEFKFHLNEWSYKCKNKILNEDDIIEKIKNSDAIIYQNISATKSSFCNTEKLYELVQPTCKLIQIPSIHFDYSNFQNSLKQLICRENKNKVNIRVSNILCKYKHTKLMLTEHHPNTWLFMELIKKICFLLNIPFFQESDYKHFLKDNNYMGLPL